MLKRYLILLIAIALVNVCFAQEVIVVKRKLDENVNEVFDVLKSNNAIRNGKYNAYYKKKTIFATGSFDNDKRVGLWQFYDLKGNITQTYNYTSKKIYYEAPELETSPLRYFVDRELNPGDTVTKPLRVGGRYYGFLPYLDLFTLPSGYQDLDGKIGAMVELLVSPGGRLADYKVHLIVPGAPQAFRVINMNLNLPNPDDLVFVPAKLNREPVSCRITIRCGITSGGHLEFLQ